MIKSKSLPEPVGFTCKRVILDPESTKQNELEIYLPDKLHATLDSAVELFEQKIKDLRKEEFEAERMLELEEDLQRKINYDKKESSRENSVELPEPVLKKQLNHGFRDDREWQQVFEMNSVDALMTKAKTLISDKELRKRDEELAKKLTIIGEYRRISTPGMPRFPKPEATPKKAPRVSVKKALARVQASNCALDDLRDVHPQFSAVIDFVAQHLALTSRSSKILTLPPILLDGEPGVGKTHFATDLADVFGSTFRRLSLDSSATGSSLIGSDRRWANTHYGMLFELICLGQYANPVILLDEIDKAQGDVYQSPIGPLHTLLEPSTAAKIRDLSVDFEFNASQVIWIATSNNSRLLSPAIRSRFQEFNIQRPDASGALASAQSVIKKAFAELDLKNFEAPGKSFAVAVAYLTPREIIRVLKQALATAISRGKNSVAISDLPAGVCDESDSASQSQQIENSGKKPSVWLH